MTQYVDFVFRIKLVLIHGKDVEEIPFLPDYHKKFEHCYDWSLLTEQQVCVIAEYPNVTTSTTHAYFPLSGPFSAAIIRKNRYSGKFYTLGYWKWKLDIACLSKCQWFVTLWNIGNEMYENIFLLISVRALYWHSDFKKKILRWGLSFSIFHKTTSTITPFPCIHITLCCIPVHSKIWSLLLSTRRRRIQKMWI